MSALRSPVAEEPDWYSTPSGSSSKYIMGDRWMRWRRPIRFSSDAIVFVVLVFFVAFGFVFLKQLEPPKLGFFCEDTSIRYPLLDSTVPDWALVIAGVLIPLTAVSRRP